MRRRRRARADETGRVVEALINRLGRHSGTRERRVVERLARLGPAAVPHLIRVLRDHRNAFARAVAATSLGRFPSRARRPLLRAFRDPAIPVRLKAMVAAAQTWTPRVATAVMALAGDPSPGIRNNALALLARHRPRRAVPIFIRALRDPVWHVRMQAARALTVMRVSRARRNLLGAAGDPHPAVRNAARQALKLLAQSRRPGRSG